MKGRGFYGGDDYGYKVGKQGLVCDFLSRKKRIKQDTSP